MRLWVSAPHSLWPSSINRSLFSHFFLTKSKSRSIDKVSRVRRSQYPQMALLSNNLLYVDNIVIFCFSLSTGCPIMGTLF